MEVGIEAARWVVGKALGPTSGGVLEAWAASTELGANIRALRMELLYAQGMLNNARGRAHGRDDIKNPALAELLQELRDLAYCADDALDEVDYFRIQDELDGTYHAADEHAGGCLRNHALNARHAAKGIGKMLGFSSCSRSATVSRGNRDEPDEGTRRAFCGAWPCRGNTTPDDEDEDDARRRVSCGVAWSCGGQTTRESTESTAGQEGVLQSGCMQKLASGARNTISTVGKHLSCYSVSSPIQNDPNSNMASSGQRFLCCARPVNKAPQREEAPKLKFDRVEMSKKMMEIAEQLKPVCAKVSTILNLELLDSNRSIAQCIATSLDAVLSKKHGYTPLQTNGFATMSRPITSAELIEPKIYGREDDTSKIICDITEGDYCDKDLIVLPIVGPGGIGKTTLTQYIYKELQHHFEEKVWVCGSTTFSVHRLTQEIADKLTKDKKGSPDRLIEEKIKYKKFLLVLDDMWSCGDDEWKRFLVPFRKAQTKGNVILVTTRFPALAQRVKETAAQPMDLEGLDAKPFKDLFWAYILGDKQSTNDHGKLLEETGDKILKKLKGSPLAAKTVGRLLGKHLDFDHWNRVLESKEWESENGKDDIMPALKLSYDYLPFHLQQCFSYCALFPEDYKFEAEELIHLWIGLDLLHSHGQNKRIEDIGADHLTELVNHGVFRKEGDGERACYVIHDLLHELALKVSSHECLSIYSYNVRSTQIPPSIRHLSINIDDTSVKDRVAFDTCRKDLGTLHKRLKVENLHSLMLFGKYYGNFVKTFGGLLKEAKALRVVFLPYTSYNVEDFLHNFSNCVHLRYLRIQSYYHGIRLPSIISRSYHLRVLDIQGCHNLHYSARDMCNLLKLRHFLVPGYRTEIHSSIFKVGKLKSLQELRRFAVRKESTGFELNQIGHLLELCGSLKINNLEKVEAEEEADEAKLIKKTHLRKLTLHWDTDGSNKDSAREAQVLERLKPSDNLLELCITGHGGATCPSWLGANISVKNLVFLRLDDVSWKNLPPLGELLLVDEQDKDYCQSYIEGQSLTNLKRLELVKIPKLRKWTGTGPCDLFSQLEVLIIEDCPELMELPFTHHTECVLEHEDHMTWFPKLEILEVARCPKLSALPCIPWSSSTRSAKIAQAGLGLECLDYGKNYNSEYCLKIEGKGGLDSAFWMAVGFHNLSELKELKVKGCPPLLLDQLQMLSSLKTLKICDSGDAVWLPEGDGCVGYQFAVQDVTIEQCGSSGERLTRLFSSFQKLRSLSMRKCEKLTGLGVVDQQKQQQSEAGGLLSSSIDEVEAAQIAQREELLLLPPQLESVVIDDCPNLLLCYTDSLARDRDTGRTGGGGRGLQQRLTSLRRSSSSPYFLFPASLEHLSLLGAVGTATLPLSNLTSLSDLSIRGCGDLRGEGLRPLLTQGRLTTLTVYKTPNFFAAFEPSPPHDQELPSSSSKLQNLETDDIAGVLAEPICTLLSSSLTDLYFLEDEKVERFTKEQEKALLLLNSLENIRFWYCDKLQHLPAGLHRLPNLKRLGFYKCAIRSLPKDGLPGSLQELGIHLCPAIRSMPKCLPNSLQKLSIAYCPAIRWLPKVGDLPSSLQELNVCGSSEELRRQCRKLIGTIPIIKT